MMDGLSHWSAAWSQYFGAAVLQNTVFLGIVFLALYALKKSSAQTRYIVAMAGLVKLLLPPFIPLASSSVATEPSWGQSVVTLVSRGQPAPASSSTAYTLPDPLSLLFVLWLAVVVAYTAFSIARTLRMAWSLRHAKPVVEPHVSSSSILRSIRVLKSDRIAVPLTIGVFPRSVFVPASWDDWTPAFRDAVLRHEVAHIARRDGLVQLGQTLAGALYFFHPLVWLLNRSLRTFREMACDDSSAGSHRFSRFEYSRCLAEIAERTTRYPLAGESVSALLRRKNEILARVRYQTKEGIMRSVPKKTLATALVALACCAVLLSWYVGEPAPRPAKAQAKQTSDSMTFVEVRIESEKKIHIGDAETTLGSFAVDFKRAIDRDPEHVVTQLRCADKLPMSVLFEVQGILIKSGFTKVSYESGETGGLPLVLPTERLAETMKSIPAEQIVNVHVSSTGQVVVGEKTVAVDKLDRAVAGALQENPLLIFSIQTKPDASYSDFIVVLRQVKAGNAQRIFIGQPAL